MQANRSIRQDQPAWYRRLLMIFSSLSLVACASLPDIRQLPQRQDTTNNPTIENSRGDLSKAKARSMLLQRVRGTHIDVMKLAAMEEAATGSALIAGNRTTLLFDGPQTMSAMLEAIHTAKDHVNLETYIFDEDELGLQFADLLIEKQRAGVQVNILYDSIGSLNTPRAFFDRMRNVGIKVIEFNPVNPLRRFDSWRLNNRDHRKILIVDGRVAFTGGVNITEEYAKSSLFRSGGGSKRHTEGLGWRDTHIQLEGPAVASMQLLFLNAWASQKDGDIDSGIPDRDYFPTLPEVGDKIVRVLGSAPGGDFEIYKAYVLAIQEARKSIHLTAAYFAPDVQLLDAIKAATQRGVEVKIIFPSFSDAGLVFHAGRSFYTELMDAGVQVFQLQASVLHAKTAVIDGVWSTVGSSNMDIRSFLHNSEVNLVIIGSTFGTTMESAFSEDLKNSLPISREAWANRPTTQRIKEWAARNFEYWL